jgi:hypothetical protein
MKGKNGHMYKVINTKSGKRWLKIIKPFSSPIKRTSRGGMSFPDPEDLSIEKIKDALKTLERDIDNEKDIKNNKLNYARLSILLKSRQILNINNSDWFMHKIKEDENIDKISDFNLIHGEKDLNKLYQSALDGTIMTYIKTL